VLSSLTAARGPWAMVPYWILLLGVVSLLAAVGAAVLTALRFIQPLDSIESGVAEIINGNRDYMFTSPGQDFEGLANGLNVMLARLLGRPDPTDDDVGDDSAQARWQGEVTIQEVGTTTGQTAAISPENAALASEPENDYLQRVFNEYVEARKANNESTDGLAFDGFAAKLRQNEAALKKKYNCRAVRFKVVVKNKQTTLKPVPIS
jgi:hypothetical protein